MPLPQVEVFLTELYHGKPKSSDLARFMGKMKHISGEGAGGEEDERRVTLDDIRSAMAQLKEEVRYLLLLYFSAPQVWSFFLFDFTPHVLRILQHFEPTETRVSMLLTLL